MANKQVRVREFTCDVCGQVQYTDLKGELPQGMHVKQLYHVSAGGDAVEDLWVCDLESCQAVPLTQLWASAFQRQWDDQHPLDGPTAEQLARRDALG